MESRYQPEEAARFVAANPSVPEPLALRTYTARLLGQNPALVLHGGGNTSVKTTMKTRLGDAVDVLCVKGSGWDLGSIEPAGHPACRMDHLRRMLACASMSDEDMVNELRLSLLDAQAPTPSVEALLHAALPATYIDHTHADAVLAVADQEDAARICQEIWGDSLLFVPYVMPGFGLAKRCDDLYRAAVKRGEKPTVMVLERHGIFTWGDTAQASYQAMIDAVTRAEQYIATKARKPAGTTASRDLALGRRVLPILRGVLSRMHGFPEEQGLLLDVRAGSLDLLERADLDAAIARGCMTPDHVIRTKPLPLRFDARPFADDAALTAAFEAAVKGYVSAYDAYVDANVKAKKLSVTRLDPFPRIVLVPGVGIVSVAATKKEAAVASDVYERTLPVMAAANDVGAYSPVSMSDLFDVEYWSLEQAKIKKQTRAALSGRVALVTGAASGIGLGTAELFLAEGAHVALVEKDGNALAKEVARLRKKHGAQVTDVVCDVTDEASVRAAFDAVVLAFGGVDIVVSNAGNAPQGLLHTEAGDAGLRASLDLNLLAHNTVARVATEVMLRQGRGGSLLFNASKSAFNQGPAFGPYAVAKTALVALMRQYAVDLGASAIRSNAVNADRVRTALFGGGVVEARARARGLTVDAYFQSNLLGREVTAEDVGRAFLHLAQARSTTGCILTVDGGNAAAFPR